jgi:hypothetical protein
MKVNWKKFNAWFDIQQYIGSHLWTTQKKAINCLLPTGYRVNWKKVDKVYTEENSWEEAKRIIEKSIVKEEL